MSLFTGMSKGKGTMVLRLREPPKLGVSLLFGFNLSPKGCPQRKYTAKSTDSGDGRDVFFQGDCDEGVKKLAARQAVFGRV